jgi:hypothetical protein
VSQGELDALVVRGYLSEGERDNGAAIKKAIEGVISDKAFELEQERSKGQQISASETFGGTRHGTSEKQSRNASHSLPRFQAGPTVPRRCRGVL